MVSEAKRINSTEQFPESPASELAFRIFHKETGTILNSEVLDYHPFKLDLSLTEKCNLRCKHCFYSVLDTVPSADIEENMLNRLIQHVFPHLRYIRLTGFNGEPLCSELFDKCLDEVARRGIDLHITTNGTLMNADRAKKISEACSVISISIEGVDESYEKVRGAKWAQLLRNIEMLSNARSVAGSSMRIILDVTILRECLGDYPLLFKMQDMGVDAIRLRHFFPLSILQVSQSLLYNMERANVFLEQMQSLGEQYDIELDMPSSFHDCNIREMCGNIVSEDQKRANCSIPWEGLALEPTGVVRACCAGPRMGQYQSKDKDLMRIWNNSAYRKLRRIINGPMAPQPCRSCPVFCRNQEQLVYPLRFMGGGLSASLGAELLSRCLSFVRKCKRSMMK